MTKIFVGSPLCWMLCLALASNTAAGQISGQMALDTSWQQVAYLSLLPSFDEMHTLNKDYIVAAAPLGKDGTFSISTAILPEEPSLYRLHFVKKGDPTATLILGGPNENHFFFVAARSDTLQLVLPNDKLPISETKVLHSAVNRVLREIDRYHKAFTEMQGGQSSLKTQLLERAFHEQLLVIADTTRFVMAGLYALYKTEIQKSEMIQNPGSEAFVEKWRDNPSPYLAHFAQELRPPSTTSGISIWHFILLVAGLGLGAAVTAFWLGKRTIPAAESSLADNLSLLSIQERKVHQMLAKGMSNKEISLELNIGVNTVKSHVSSILGKLKAKSRKELME